MVQTGPQIENPTGVSLFPGAEKILRTMFADYHRVVVQAELGGGLSGGRILLVQPIKREHQLELPTVVKMAPIDLIDKEWHAYRECIRDRMPGVAEIRGNPVVPQGGSWGGLRYTLMGGGVFEIESLYRYCRHASVEDINHVLNERLFKRMGPLWQSGSGQTFALRTSYDRLLPINLLIEPTIPPPGSSICLLKPGVSVDQFPTRGDYVRLEGFVVVEIDQIQEAVTLNLTPQGNGPVVSYRLRLQPVKSIEGYRIRDIIDPVEGIVTADRQDLLRDQARQALGSDIDLDANTVILPNDVALPNPLFAWPEILSVVRDVKFAYIHGDLNLENILVDLGTRDVGLIDFADARCDHVLHDLLRLETEVVTKLLPETLTKAEQSPETVAPFYEQLHLATFHPDQFARPSLPHANLEKLLEMLIAIRQMAHGYLFDPDDWSEYYQCLTLYLLGALKFKNLDRLATAPLPKQVAFWAAATVYGFVKPAGPPARIYWEPLRRYLPAEMYQERNAATCLAHLRQLLRVVATYLPRHLALDLLQKPVVAKNSGQFLEGTLLFTDISGFASLSEKLKKMEGKVNAEALVRLINAYLEVMLDILFKYDGRLIRFGGEGMLCLFTGSRMGAMDAVRAAWEMRRVMRERFDETGSFFETLSPDESRMFQEIFPLEMTAGGNSGLLFSARIGNDEHMEYVLTGSAVERTARAESAAGKGDILVSHETYDLIKDNVEAEELAQRPDLYRVEGIRTVPIPRAERSWTKIEECLLGLTGDFSGIVNRLDALTPYLPAGVLPQLVNHPRRGQVEGQHRRVTILFANFTGMSEIINARGCQDEAGIIGDLSEYFEAMQEEIRYYGGIVSKVDLYGQGDKLMVIFGAPRSHEKDAQRAALTALAMQEAMSRLSSPIASMFLSQRIGIHTGFVFAGNVGSSVNNRYEYAVIGDAVNLAERLMSEAPPGKVWVSQRVWDRIRDSFEGKAQPPMRLADSGDPIAVVQLEGTRSLPEGEEPLRALCSEMVGRERELEALGKCYAALLSGSGRQIVAVTGEAGTGKTRLVAEWRQITALTGTTTTWLSARGHPYGQKAHGVFIEILEQLLAFSDDDSQEERWNQLSTWLKESFAEAEPGWLSEFLNKLAYLGQFLSLDLSTKQELTERVSHLEAETLQVQTYVAVCDLLMRAAQASPLVLVLEDLHWVDDASLDMLEYVLNRMNDDIPILWCLIFRPLKERPIWQAWQDIEHSHPGCHSMSLRELGDEEGRQLLSYLLHTSQLPDDFVALILDETDGNPLYVEEVLHTLIEGGVIVQDKVGWQILQRVDRIHVPDTLYQIIQSRIDELDTRSPGSRRVLWMAAVIGETFTEDLLQHLFTTTGRQEGISKHLQALQGAAMIQRGEIEGDNDLQHTYQFRHGLVRQVAYENVLVGKRREYHCEVGRWLEGRHREDLQRHYDALAYHYDQGGRWKKAFQYHWLSGQRDAQIFANQDAMFHLQRALEIASSAAPGDLALGQAHFELGKVLVVVGAFDDALEHLETAHDLLGRAHFELAAVLLRARVCHHIGRTYERKGGTENLKAVLEWQNKGLELLPKTPTAEAAMLHAAGGMVNFRQGKFDQAVEKGKLALDLAQAASAPVELGLAHRLLSVAFHAQGDLGLAMEHCQRDIEHCEKLPDLIGLIKSYSNRGVFALEMDDWQLAQESYLQALATLERVGDEFELARAYCNLGDLYFHLGKVEEGLVYAQRSLSVFIAAPSLQGEIIARAVLATLFWRRGDLEQARAQLLKAKELVEEVTMFKPTVGRWLAQVYLTAGDAPQAESELESLCSLDADMLADDAEPIQRLWGQVLAAQGKPNEAIQTLEESLERLEQNEMRYQAGCTRLALAGVLAQVEGRAAEARNHAERARAIFTDLGAKLDIQETEKLLTKL